MPARVVAHAGIKGSSASRRRFSSACLALVALLAGCGSELAVTAEVSPSAAPTLTVEPTPQPTPRPTPEPTPQPTATAEPTPEPVALPAGAITATDAAGRVGEWVTVCGTVMTANYAIDSGGQPTFLNLDLPYPDHVLTLIVWAEDRWMYPTGPEEAFAPPAQVCAEGTVETYNGRPQVVPLGPITLAQDWVTTTGSGFDVDCSGIDDPEVAQICWDITADYYDFLEEMGQDAMDDWYDTYDPYAP